MQIAAIIGSYGKGNTYSVVQKIEERMKKLGDVEFKYVFLSQAGLLDCKGCMTCLSKGESLCPLKDGLADLEKLLMDCDGAIFASPNHACGTTALMRRLNERFAYIAHRPRFFGKYAVAVTTSGGPVGIKQTLKDMSFFAGGGFTFVGKLGLMTPPVEASEKTLKQQNRKINACADRLYHAIRDKRAIRPTFGGMMQFAAFRGMYIRNPKLGEAAFPADMEYWREKGWLAPKAKYFFTGGLGPVKRLFGLLFETVIGAASVGMKPKGAKTEESKAG